MERPPEEDTMNSLFRAKYTGKYLEDYVDNVKIDGRSLRERVQFNVQVQTVEKHGELWYLMCTQSDSTSTTKALATPRLMMANGQTSVPRMPNLSGRELFEGKIIHSLDYGQSDVMTNDGIKHITVLGGGKSAADMVYESVKAGKTVTWVIRKTGDGSTGPGFFAPADVPTPYESPGYAAQTRVMSSLQPCYMNPDTWWARFLHRTSFGMGLVKWIFDQADIGIRKRAAYKERESTKGFEKLEYESSYVSSLFFNIEMLITYCSIFWPNGVAGILHHEDFFPLVAEKVQVHRVKVKKLLKNELYLDNDDGTHYPCDAILCGTGWHRGLDMFSDDLKIQLGLPYPKSLDAEPLEGSSKWAELIASADKAIINRFHILRNPPPHPHIESQSTPYRLYRGMAPLHDDSILFLNHIIVANKLFGAEAQAMWAVAWFDKDIRVPLDSREQDVATWIAWCRRRYLSNGSLGNEASFDMVPYVDTLLDEMDVSGHRQKGWTKNFFATVMPADLGRAWTEYLGRSRK
jgi:dimethylaniline monooxygenase (N-oxide forming)